MVAIVREYGKKNRIRQKNTDRSNWFSSKHVTLKFRNTLQLNASEIAVTEDNGSIQEDLKLDTLIADPSAHHLSEGNLCTYPLHINKVTNSLIALFIK